MKEFLKTGQFKSAFVIQTFEKVEQNNDWDERSSERNY